MFPETLNQPLPQTVNDVEQMNINNRPKKNIQLKEQSLDRSNQQNRELFHRF